MSNIHKGYVFISDISGYTGYLSTSELEHAQAILSVLLNLLTAQVKEPLIISRTAGDAVISYGVEENFFKGQVFLELIDETYNKFKESVKVMSLNNTCNCRACTNIVNLDLKFFVNYGTFAIQSINDHDELVGSDINLIHRLLKNSVIKTTGIKAYTLFTNAAIKKLGLTSFTKSLKSHKESYEHLGEVDLWVYDLSTRWDNYKKINKKSLKKDDIIAKVECEINLPREVVWNYLIQPKYRKTLMGSNSQKAVGLKGGLIKTESKYYCYHGDRIIPQVIIEWQPFSRIVTKDLWPLPFPGIYCFMQYDLVETKKGTLLREYGSKAQGSLPGRIMADFLMKQFEKKSMLSVNEFKKRVEEDYFYQKKKAFKKITIQ